MASRGEYVFNIDMNPNENAHDNFLVTESGNSRTQIEAVKEALGAQKEGFDGILVTAGGWNGKGKAKKRV